VHKRLLAALAGLWVLPPAFACSGSGPAASKGSGGTSQSGGQNGSGGSSGSGAISGSGGTPGSGGSSGSSGASQAIYEVAMVQSSKELAADLTASDVAELVSNAVSMAGGLGLIKDGQTVVLKPNLVSFYEDDGEHTATDTVNGISTDWRVVKAVADLVRAKNQNGKILVMEGSTFLTVDVYPVLGYTADNFGPSIDEFIGMEGRACDDTSTSGLDERTGRSGKPYWVRSRYAAADVVIGIPTLATDAWAGVGLAVESQGIGATPAGQYGGTNSVDCKRTKIDRSTPEAASAFIRDYYGLRPADFVVMDGLQGLEHGPLPVWDDSGAYDYASSKKNMRLILAGKEAVAVDTIAALVMKCDPKKVSHLKMLEADGVGTTDATKIHLIGKQVADVAKPFASRQADICPGK